ncbi:hypothetical protein [Mycoplasma seminis]|uniref:Uncharacterized protein n=1 Tax=Mycoplasma seminis TaxID=512749 RepID=A0ABY9H9R6_9MOLU|nr:hypothetical protein [Mycoplasma seminis]WLP85330.1 hypothetical protein Q8852_03335 [Mycoplasma seminis]
MEDNLEIKPKNKKWTWYSIIYIILAGISVAMVPVAIVFSVKSHFDDKKLEKDIKTEKEKLIKELTEYKESLAPGIAEIKNVHLPKIHEIEAVAEKYNYTYITSRIDGMVEHLRSYINTYNEFDKDILEINDENNWFWRSSADWSKNHLELLQRYNEEIIKNINTFSDWTSQMPEKFPKVFEMFENIKKFKTLKNDNNALIFESKPFSGIETFRNNWQNWKWPTIVSWYGKSQFYLQFVQYVIDNNANDLKTNVLNFIKQNFKFEDLSNWRWLQKRIQDINQKIYTAFEQENINSQTWEEIWNQVLAYSDQYNYYASDLKQVIQWHENFDSEKERIEYYLKLNAFNQKYQSVIANNHGLFTWNSNLEFNKLSERMDKFIELVSEMETTGHLMLHLDKPQYKPFKQQDDINEQFLKQNATKSWFVQANNELVELENSTIIKYANNFSDSERLTEILNQYKSKSQQIMDKYSNQA